MLIKVLTEASETNLSLGYVHVGSKPVEVKVDFSQNIDNPDSWGVKVTLHVLLEDVEVTYLLFKAADTGEDSKTKMLSAIKDILKEFGMALSSHIPSGIFDFEAKVLGRLPQATISVDTTQEKE